MRQEKPWQGGCDELKPCIASQQVQHLPGKGVARQPEASVAWRAATHVVKRTQAGGEATLLSLEILNVDVLVLIIAGAALEAPLQARRNGSSGVKERPHSHGMARRGTWEAVRQEGAQEGASPPCSRAAREMGERPPGAAVQAEAPNRPLLLRVRDVVVSRWEKAGR